MESKHKFKAGDVVLTQGQFGKSKAVIEAVFFKYDGDIPRYRVRFMSNSKGALKPKTYDWRAEIFDTKSELLVPAGKLGTLLYGNDE